MSTAVDKYFDPRPLRELDDQRALVRAETDYELAVENKRQAIERAKRYDHIYKTLDPPDSAINETTGLIDDDEGLYSNTFLPIGKAIVDSGAAQLYNLLFSTPEYFEIEADDWEDFFFANEVTAHQKYRHQQMKFRHTCLKAIQDACIFDYAITMTRWKLQGGYVPVPKKSIKTVTLGNITMKQQQVRAEVQWMPDKIDRSDFMLIPFDQCYHDWAKGIEDFEDSRFFITERYEPIEKLVAESKLVHPWGKYNHIDTIIKAVSDKEQPLLENLGSDQQTEHIFSRRVKIVTYWTRDHFIDFAFGLVLRRVNIWDWPFQKWQIFRVPNEFGGMGLLEPLERNQLDINASGNARRNLQNLISNPFGVADQSLFADEDGEPRLYPGKLAISKRGDVREKLMIYTPGTDTNITAFQDIETQVAMTERAAGISEAMQGAVSQGRTTAREIEQVQQGAGGRIFTIASKLEAVCLEPAYFNLFLLEQVYLSKEEAFSQKGKYGDLFFTVGPANYMWKSLPRFKAKGVLSKQNDAVETQQFMTALGFAIQLPQFHNIPEILTEMWRRLVPKNYEKFVKDPSIPQHNVPPETENLMIALGRNVEVSPLNNAQEHLKAHNALKQTPDFLTWPADRKQNLERHIQEHMASGAPTNPMRTEGTQDGSDVSRGIRGPMMGAPNG